MAFLVLFHWNGIDGHLFLHFSLFSSAIVQLLMQLLLLLQLFLFLLQFKQPLLIEHLLLTTLFHLLLSEMLQLLLAVDGVAVLVVEVGYAW